MVPFSTYCPRSLRITKVTDPEEMLPPEQRHKWIFKRGEGRVCSKCLSFRHKLDDEAIMQPKRGAHNYLWIIIVVATEGVRKVGPSFER